MGALVNQQLKAKQETIPFKFWTPFPEEFDLLPGRVVGITQYLILVFILRRTFFKRAPGSPPPLYTAITLQEFAKYCNPTGSKKATSMIQRALEDLEERGFIEAKSAAEAKVGTKTKGHRAKVYRLRLENWASIEYLEDAADEPEAEEPEDAADEPEAEEPAEAAGPCLVVMPGKRAGAMIGAIKADWGNRTTIPLLIAARENQGRISFDVSTHDKGVADSDLPLGGYIKTDAGERAAPATLRGRAALQPAQPAAAVETLMRKMQEVRAPLTQAEAREIVGILSNTSVGPVPIDSFCATVHKRAARSNRNGDSLNFNVVKLMAGDAAEKWPQAAAADARRQNNTKRAAAVRQQQAEESEKELRERLADPNLPPEDAALIRSLLGVS